jgi:predicted acyl esterase
LEEGVRYNFDDTAPDGIKAVRYYVVGNVGENKKFGNYWVAADTFPNPQLPRQKLYLHRDGTLSTDPPVQNEGTVTYIADPNTPVPTHGGPNMIVRTPDDKRDSQGQMNFTDPLYRNLVRDRMPQIINGDTVYDIVTFETDAIADSFSIAGIPVATFYAASTPLSQIVPDSTNCDFILRVVDVYPDGRELYVFEGAVNARARDYAKKWAETHVEDVNVPWSNIVSGRIYEYKVRMLPIAYTFAEGHKIKLMVSSTSYPRYQACANIPLQAGEFYRRRPYEDKSYNFYGTTLYPRKALQTLAISDVYAANIDFPVVGKPATFVSRERALTGATSAKFILYPNPAADVVAVGAEKPGYYRYSIFDPLGREVLVGSFHNVATIYTDQLPRGVYSVKISENSGASAVKKLVLN